MPASEIQTIEFQDQCAKAVCGILGMSHHGEAGMLAAHMFSPEEEILGMGVANADEIGMAQDVKAIMTALESKDEVLAATLWTAVKRGTDSSGRVATSRGRVKVPSEQMYDTVLARL